MEKRIRLVVKPAAFFIPGLYQEPFINANIL